MSKNKKVMMALMGLEIGGAETHVLELCKALKEQGVEIIVVSNGGIYEKELTDFGIKHIKAPLHNKNLFNIIKSYKILKKTIIENDIKLVHSHARIPSFLIGLLKKRLDFRFVTTAHLNFRTTFPFNILSNWGEASLAVSEDIKDYLIEKYNVSSDKILLTVNGIDTEKFSENTSYSDIKSEFNLNDDNERIVYISRMDKDRSLVALQLIEITPYLYDKYKNIEIIIVGGGDDFNTVARSAKKVNEKLGKNVLILTDQRADINNFIASADYFVGVSRSVLEALSSGKPCIVTGNQGYIGIFNENVLDVSISTNFCCRGLIDSTPELIKNDLEKLLSMNEEEKEALSKYGRSVILNMFSARTMALDALKLYDLVKQSKRDVDIVISGYYGFRNSGDDTILMSIIESLKKEKPDINITVLSRRHKETAEIYNTKTINRFNLIKIWKQLRKTKLLLSGGGTLVQDLTSTQSLIYYLSIMWLAKKCGAKNMLYANGIGPLKNEKNKALTKKVLNKVDLITLRDEESKTALNELGINLPKKITTADPAFIYTLQEKSSRDKILKQLMLNGKYFVVSLRNWKFLCDNFEQKIANFCDYIFEKYGLSPLFIPMQFENDEEISKSVISKLINKGYFLDQIYTTNDIISIMQKADFVIAMRLHSVIYSAIASTPIIGLVYDPKVENLMKAAKQTTYISVSELNEVNLVEFATKILNDNGSIKKTLQEFSNNSKLCANKNNELVLEMLE